MPTPPRPSARVTPRLFLGLCAALAAPPAMAGPTLVSRDSGLRASGASAAGEYDLSNGSGDFAVFADAVGSDAAAAARSRAEQNSRPQIEGDTGAFVGATADGAAHAAVDGAASDAFSSAQSDFDLVFRVEGAPSRVLLDCTLDAAGDGTAGLKLYDTTTLETAFADEVSGDSRSSRGDQTLAPGTYGVSVWAFARGTPDDSSASYHINLTVASDAPTPAPVPMPLPPAAWAGLALFAMVLVATPLSRRRQAATVQ
jgi:hypothetical protein